MDTFPITNIDLSGRARAGRLTREQAEAHARLAALPTRRHERKTKDTEAAAKERAQRVAMEMRARGTARKGKSAYE